MWQFRFLVSALLVSLLAACGTPAPQSSTGSSAGAGAAAQPAKQAGGAQKPDGGIKPFTLVSVNGPLLHVHSGFSFPPEVGPYERNLRGVNVYNEAGDDVSVDYNDVKAHVHVTLYVYPTGGLSLQQELDRRIHEVTDSGLYEDVKVLGSGKVALTPKKREGLSARFTFTTKNRDGSRGFAAGSTLAVGQQGDWFIEYRLTYPVGEKKQAEVSIQKMLAGFEWP